MTITTPKRNFDGDYSDKLLLARRLEIGGIVQDGNNNNNSNNESFQPQQDNETSHHLEQGARDDDGPVGDRGSVAYSDDSSDTQLRKGVLIYLAILVCGSLVAMGIVGVIIWVIVRYS